MTANSLFRTTGKVCLKSQERQGLDRSSGVHRDPSLNVIYLYCCFEKKGILKLQICDRDHNLNAKRKPLIFVRK